VDARLLRLSLRLIQADLAAKAGTSQTTVCAFERGSRRVSPEIARRIVAALIAEGLVPTGEGVSDSR
jgi:transcriptional regulator with XRE-family HTH domain